MIEIRNLTHIYRKGCEDEVLGLEAVNLTVSPSEFVVILGHNGSGKSTLAKHLNGLLLPTEGEVIVAGLNTKESERIWDIRRKVGMIFQNPDNQIVATIVEEDVAFALENLGLPSSEIRRRVDRALDLVDLLEYARREPHLLSGGQKQRVAIAGVLALEPEYLVLDEPTAMLDAQGRKEVLDTLRGLNLNRGVTVLHITHFVEEAFEASRVVVMAKGRIVWDGVPAALFSNPTLLRRLEIAPPPGVYLTHLLSQRGLALPSGLLSTEKIAEALCALK
jgi:energy-coupling factor transport system ATP-binding protein